MERTIPELMEKMSQLDELTILELLDVTSEELVVFLQDQIVDKCDDLNDYFDDEEELDPYQD